MGRKTISEQERNRGSELAERIQKRRLELDLKQTDLSVVSGIGIDTVRAIEGKKIFNPGIFTLFDLATALQTDLEALVPPKNSKHLKSDKKGKNGN